MNENKLSLQPDINFHSESNGRNFVTSFCEEKENNFSDHQVALASKNYNNSTQNRKLHQAVAPRAKTKSDFLELSLSLKISGLGKI